LIIDFSIAILHIHKMSTKEPRKENKEHKKKRRTEPKKKDGKEPNKENKEEILKLIELEQNKIPCFLYVVQKKNNILVGMVSSKNSDHVRIEYFCNQVKKNNPKYTNCKRWFWNKRYYELVFSL